VDQRALDLLEMLVERRAAELKNQPGPHLEAALTALQRAFKREWPLGEQRLMADLLANLGAISQPTLARHHLRQLEILHREQTRGTLDRLRIAESYAQSLGSYSRSAEAVDLLESALKEFQDANNGVLPTLANSAITRVMHYLQVLGHHTRAEKYL